MGAGYAGSGSSDIRRYGAGVQPRKCNYQSQSRRHERDDSTVEEYLRYDFL